MIEYLRLKKRKKFTQKIRELLGYTEYEKKGMRKEEIYKNISSDIHIMEKKIGATYNTIKNWLEGKFPTSEYIQKILEEYDLEPDELGVEVIKLSDFSERLETLKNEKGFNNKQLAIFLDVSSPTITEWLKGNKIPSIKTMIEIADKFEVHYLYLLGVIEEKQATFSVINKLIGIDEKTSIALLEYKTMSKYGEDLRAEIEKKCGFTYREIVQDVIQDTEFIDAIYFEIYRILSYRLTDYKDSFDDFMNTIDLEFSAKELGANSDGSIPFPTNNRISQEEISNLIVTKCLDKMINDMVKKYEKISINNWISQEEISKLVITKQLEKMVNDMVNKYYEIAKKKGFLKNENPLLYNMGSDIK